MTNGSKAQMSPSFSQAKAEFSKTKTMLRRERVPETRSRYEVQRPGMGKHPTGSHYRIMNVQ